MHNRRPIALAVYGSALIASGVYRYLTASSAINALGFGLVMGTWAIVAALLMFVRLRPLGLILGWAAVLIAGVWFCMELEDKYRQPRIWMLVALSIVTIILLAWPARKAIAPTA